MRICVTLALILVPQVISAGEQHRVTRLPGVANSQSVVTDVALQDGGVLKGQLVDSSGAPHTNMQVVLAKNGKLVETAKSNQNGQFVVTNMKAGVYQINTPQSSGVFRVWAPRTAPPNSKAGVLMISGGDVVRGQPLPQPQMEPFGPAQFPPYGADRVPVEEILLLGGVGIGVYFLLDYNASGS